MKILKWINENKQVLGFICLVIAISFFMQWFLNAPAPINPNNPYPSIPNIIP